MPVRPWIAHVDQRALAGTGAADGVGGVAAADGGELVWCRSYEIPAETGAEAILAHVRRLSTLSHANLVPVLGAETVEGRLWVYSEYDGGRTLADVLAHGGLSAPQAVAIGLSVLSGLQSLQRSGFAHGALDTRSVQVASYGQVRLTDYGLRPRLVSEAIPSWGDPRRDVSAAGEVLCSALGIDPARPAGTQPTVLERSMPALAATALTIASGSAGRSASTALMMLSDGAGRLAARSRVYLSIAELGRLANAGSPAITAAVDSVLNRPGATSAAELEAERLRTAGLKAQELQAQELKAQELKAQELKAQELKAQELKAQELKAQELKAQELADRRESAAAAAAAAAIARPVLPATESRERARRAARTTILPVAAANLPPAPARHRRLGGPLLVPGLLAAAGLLMLVVAVGPMVNRSLHHPSTRSSPGPAKPAAGSLGSVRSTPAPASVADSSAGVVSAAGPDSAPLPAAATPTATPQAAVTAFYGAALQHRFDQAVALWSERMRINYPPPANINERFAGTTVLTVNQARLSSSAGGVATVYVDLSEVTYGVSYHWLGTWRLVQTDAGWLLDQPDFQSA